MQGLVREGESVKKLWECRLLVVGRRREVRRFVKSGWDLSLGARHSELLENAPTRFACQFEADSLPTGNLSALSRRQPKLVFLLHYEVQKLKRVCLARAKRGIVEAQEFAY